MQTKPVIHVVGLEYRPEAEEEFNRWFDDVHVPMMLKCPGVIGITRYELVTEGGVQSHDLKDKGAEVEYPKALAIMEFESVEAVQRYESSPERAEALEETKETWKDGGMSVKWRVQYQTVDTWRK